MLIKPKTEKEIAELNLWPAGIYNFQIADAKEEVSKTSNNEQIKLSLNVYNESGICRIVYDYLSDAVPHKVRHLCEICGLLDKYESGAIYAQDFINKTGDLRLYIRKDRNGKYPDSNAVGDYIVRENNHPNNNTILDDIIPF